MTKEATSLKFRLLADFALLIITAIWGSTFVMVDTAIETMNVLVFIALRFSIAFVILLIIFGYQLFKNKIRLIDIGRGVIIGIFLFIGYIFQTFGLDLGTEPGKAAFITGLYVVLVPIFSAILLKKKPHWLSWIGISVAVIGLGLLSLKSFTSFQFQDIFGDLMVFICTFGFAFHIIFIDKSVEKTHYTSLAVFQIGTTAVLAWLAALIFSPTTSIFAVPVFPIIFN
ncbi:MAG: DMT family transporter, partial [Candidatus Thorarchaeota archaeon]